MHIRERLRPLWWSILVIGFLVGSFCTINYVRARSLPGDQSAVEDQLDRDVYAYIELNGDGYVATEFGNRVIFDFLVLDPKPMGFPPEPRWQWSGNWTAIPVTVEPASAAVGAAGSSPVLFGQINDLSIISMDISNSKMNITASVQAPGFGIVLDELIGGVQQVRFLNEAGDVVYEIDI